MTDKEKLKAYLGDLEKAQGQRITSFTKETTGRGQEFFPALPSIAESSSNPVAFVVIYVFHKFFSTYSSTASSMPRAYDQVPSAIVFSSALSKVISGQ